MSGAAQYVGKDERRRHRAILDLDLNRTKRYKVSRRSMAGQTNETDEDDETNGTNGRTDDEPRAEDVPRGAGLSAIDECQVTTKVVEEYWMWTWKRPRPVDLSQLVTATKRACVTDDES